MSLTMTSTPDLCKIVSFAIFIDLRCRGHLAVSRRFNIRTSRDSFPLLNKNALGECVSRRGGAPPAWSLWTVFGGFGMPKLAPGPVWLYCIGEAVIALTNTLDFCKIVFSAFLTIYDVATMIAVLSNIRLVRIADFG